MSREGIYRMPFEHGRFTRREVLKATVLALASGVVAGCDEDLGLPRAPGALVTIGSLRIVGYGMYDAFRRWLLAGRCLGPGAGSIHQADL